MITAPSVWGALNDRGFNGLFDVTGAGAPTNGASGTGVNVLGPGSKYYDLTNNIVYLQVGTLASPFWQIYVPALAGTGGDFVTRQRFSTAQVNTGATILPAIPGWRYRMVDMTMIAIGGAAGGATLVRITGLVSAALTALLGTAIAALTQSAVVRAGAANATVIADGASFTQQDANAPILIDKTGASLTTSTAIDVIITYQIEK